MLLRVLVRPIKLIPNGKDKTQHFFQVSATHPQFTSCYISQISMHWCLSSLTVKARGFHQKAVDSFHAGTFQNCLLGLSNLANISGGTVRLPKQWLTITWRVRYGAMPGNTFKQGPVHEHTQKWNIKYHHGPPVTSSKCSWQPRFFSNRIDLPPNLWKIHPALPYLLWMLPLATKENGLQMFAWLDCAGASRSLLQLAWEQASI